MHTPPKDLGLDDIAETYQCCAVVSLYVFGMHHGHSVGYTIHINETTIEILSFLIDYCPWRETAKSP